MLAEGRISWPLAFYFEEKQFPSGLRPFLCDLFQSLSISVDQYHILTTQSNHKGPI